VTTIAVAVVLRHGHVLVGRRAADAVDAGGLDEFPGGKVGPDESAAAAAVRECLEEAGVAIRVDALLDHATGTSANGPIDILFFVATPLIDREEPLVPFAWVPIEELAARSFPPANARVLARLAQGGS
jgi:8-oxo-dGTP diphosphatase